MFDLRIAPTLEKFARAAADSICAAADESVKSRGVCHIALAGGSTPLAAYRELAATPEMPWKRTHLFWSDERCVPPGHPDSNFGAAQTALFVRVQIPRSRIHRIRGEDDPSREVLRYEFLIRKTIGGALPKFDIIILGVGADGHTASLFTGGDALEESQHLIATVCPPEGFSHPRVTFTLPLINAARNVLFLVSGAEKASVVGQILEGRGGNLPAGLVCPGEGALRLILDETAASALGNDLRQAGRQRWADQSRPGE